MAQGVMLDTSYLITLADKSRGNHLAARRYWRHFVESGMPVFLSTIVVSEFCMRQEIHPGILRCCVVLPFNWDHALCAARLDGLRMRPPGIERVALKDDIKILAQAAVADAAFVISDDANTFCRYGEAFRESGEVSFRAIALDQGFDSAFFDDNGQRDLIDSLDDEADVDSSWSP